MKQQDVAVVIAIVFFAGIFSFVLAGKFVTPATNRRQAEVVTPISKEFPVPSTSIFNAEAINPTRLIQVAPNDNDKPFSDSDT